MSDRHEVWQLGQLLRNGAAVASVTVGDQRWTSVTTSVVRWVVTNAKRTDEIYLVRLRLYGSLQRQRRVLILLDGSQIDCPELSADITQTVSDWLRRSCESGYMIFRPGCQAHPTCRAALIPDHKIVHFLMAFSDWPGTRERSGPVRSRERALPYLV